MKQTVLICLSAGMLGGFVVGYASRKPATLEPELQALAEAPVAEAASTSRPREQELLLQAINELNLTAAELEGAQEYIRKLERNTQRYNWLMDYWKEKGFGTSYQMRFGSHGGLSFEPSEDLVDYFGWDAQQVERIEQIGRQASDAILDWESGHAVCVEETENKLVYQVEAIPEEISQQFLQAMEAELEPDDMELLRSKLQKKFAGMLQERQVSMTIGPPPDHMASNTGFLDDQQWMKVEVKNTPNASNPASAHMGNSSSWRQYNPGKTVSPRWNHLFNMESSGPDLPDELLGRLTKEQLKQLGVDPKWIKSAQ